MYRKKRLCLHGGVSPEKKKKLDYRQQLYQRFEVDNYLPVLACKQTPGEPERPDRFAFRILQFRDRLATRLARQIHFRPCQEPVYRLLIVYYSHSRWIRPVPTRNLLL